MLNEENNYACQNSSNEHMCNLFAHARVCWKQHREDFRNPVAGLLNKK